MINVSKHIYDLLFEHDCVIIPNFGGFVANYAPSKYDSSKNIITPPKKHLLFNKNLINNDGLLVHRVSALEQLSYDQALKVVQEYSSSLLSQLNAAKRIELSGVGILFLSDNQYRFKSDETNFLISSFGLPVISAIPSSNELVQTDDQTPVIPITPELKKTVKAAKYWWVAAVLLPFVFYTAWIPLKTNLLTDHSQFHYSDLNPFSFEKAKNYYSNSLVFCENGVTINTKDWKASISVNNQGDYGKYNLDGDGYVTVLLSDKKSAIPVSTHVELAVNEVPINSSTSNNKYFLIGGCFKKETNAKGFLESLRELGYRAVEIDVHRGLHRIAISGYGSRKEAKRARTKILKDQGISSWILKVK